MSETYTELPSVAAAQRLLLEAIAEMTPEERVYAGRSLSLAAHAEQAQGHPYVSLGYSNLGLLMVAVHKEQEAAHGGS